MLIKQDSSNKGPIRKLRSNASRLKRPTLYVIGCFAVLVSIVFYVYTTKPEDLTVERERTRISEKDNLWGVVNKYTRGFFARPEKITLDIKHLDFQKLAYLRSRALRNGIITLEIKEYVPIKIRYQNRTLSAKARLKGVWLDHLADNKWSFHLNLKGEDTLFGMEEFTIQHPKTRYFMNEWVFHKLLAHENLISLRYKFVQVVVNGKDWGIYALEEHFGKLLIENNQLLEGPIIKLTEDILIDDIFETKISYSEDSVTGLQEDRAAYITAYNMNRIKKNPRLYNQFIQAKDMLQAFMDGKTSTYEVFDIQKLARYFAICEIAGALHSSHWNNLRFYYNPITSLLEPIGFDSNSGALLFDNGTYPLRIAKGEGDRMHKLIFSDLRFFEEYSKNLERLADQQYMDQFFKGIEKELQKNISIIYKEFPDYWFSGHYFYENQRLIRAILSPAAGIHSYFVNKKNNIVEFEIGNIQPMPVKVLGLVFRGEEYIAVEKETILKPSLIRGPVNFRSVKFNLPQGFAWDNSMVSDLKVQYVILGTSKIQYDDNIQSYPYDSEDYIQGALMQQKSNVQEFAFIEINDSDKKMLIKPGKWEIDRNLIIPPGYRVYASAGTQISLTKESKIISFSPFEFWGTEEEPILIHSKNLTGQGIFILNAGEQSSFHYVNFRDLSQSIQGNWSLTGAVTFYESPVVMKNCRFSNNRSEDSLNIVRSDFIIDRVIFENASSDALDVDFGYGRIMRSSFINSGNDAIDVSGSQVEISDVFINKAGDKGLSFGEKSRGSVDDVTVRNAVTAIAVKDLSQIQINRVLLSDSQTGIAVYQKKPEFGPGFVWGASIKMRNITAPYLVETDSMLTVDQKRITPNQAKGLN